MLIIKYLNNVLFLQSEHSKAFKCGTFGASNIQQRHLATGNFDGRLQIWFVQGIV